MSVDRQRRVFALGVLAVSASALAGCASQLADLQQPDPSANPSADAPADPSAVAPADASSQPSQASTYLPVEDLPSGSGNDVITPAQRAKIEAELIAARDRQAAALQNAEAK